MRRRFEVNITAQWIEGGITLFHPEIPPRHMIWFDGLGRIGRILSMRENFPVRVSTQFVRSK